MKIQKVNKTLLEMYPAYKKVMKESFDEPENLGYGQCAPVIVNRIPEAENLIKKLSTFSEEDAMNSEEAKYYINELKRLDKYALDKLDEIYDFKNYADRRVDALVSNLNNLRKIIHSSPFMVGESLKEAFDDDATFYNKLSFSKPGRKEILNKLEDLAIKYYNEYSDRIEDFGAENAVGVAMEHLDDLGVDCDIAQYDYDNLIGRLNDFIEIKNKNESLKEDVGTNEPTQKNQYEITYLVNGEQHKETKQASTQDEAKQQIKDKYTTSDNVQFTQVRQVPFNPNLQKSKLNEAEDDKVGFEDEEDFSYIDDDYTGDQWGEFSDDEVEDDIMHSKVYGGDPSYCEICGTKLQYEDGYPYCPECKKEIEIEDEENI